MRTTNSLSDGEIIIKTANGDCWETPNVSGFQTPGSYTFTNKRILFKGNGVIESLRLVFEIPYSEIQSIEPYTVLFFKTGIRIRLKNGDRYRLSLMKRRQYMDIINQYKD